MKGEAPLKLLLFAVGGVHFGLFAEQVVKVTAYRGEQSDHLLWFHRELGFLTQEMAYGAPSVVAIRMPDGQLYNLVIDAMEDIVTCRYDDIHLLPALVEPFALRSGIWGVLPRHGKLVLLVDILRLLAERRS